MYNENVCCRYTSSRITRYTSSRIKKCLLLLYIFLYNNNKHFLIRELVYRVIRDDV